MFLRQAVRPMGFLLFFTCEKKSNVPLSDWLQFLNFIREECDHTYWPVGCVTCISFSSFLFFFSWKLNFLLNTFSLRGENTVSMTSMFCLHLAAENAVRSRTFWIMLDDMLLSQYWLKTRCFVVKTKTKFMFKGR